MKPVYVTFITKKREDEFENLRKGDNHDRKLYSSINASIPLLKCDPFYGIKIQQKLWPKQYVRKYEITNLWKYDLLEGYRLMYTIKTDDTMTLIVLLDWLNHKRYERTFKY